MEAKSSRLKAQTIIGLLSLLSLSGLFRLSGLSGFSGLNRALILRIRSESILTTGNEALPGIESNSLTGMV